MASIISEVKFDLRFETGNLKYPDIHVPIASDGHLRGVWGHGGFQMTSEVKADLKIELSDLNCLCSHASLACKGFLETIHTNDDIQRPIMIDKRASEFS